MIAEPRRGGADTLPGDPEADEEGADGREVGRRAIARRQQDNRGDEQDERRQQHEPQVEHEPGREVPGSGKELAGRTQVIVGVQHVGAALLAREQGPPELGLAAEGEADRVPVLVPVDWPAVEERRRRPFLPGVDRGPHGLCGVRGQGRIEVGEPLTHALEPPMTERSLKRLPRASPLGCGRGTGVRQRPPEPVGLAEAEVCRQELLHQLDVEPDHRPPQIANRPRPAAGGVEGGGDRGGVGALEAGGADREPEPVDPGLDLVEADLGSLGRGQVAIAREVDGFGALACSVEVRVAIEPGHLPAEGKRRRHGRVGPDRRRCGGRWRPCDGRMIDPTRPRGPLDGLEGEALVAALIKAYANCSHTYVACTGARARELSFWLGEG